MILLYIPLRFTPGPACVPLGFERAEVIGNDDRSPPPVAWSAPDPGRLRRLRANPRLTMSRATEIPGDDETLLRT